MDTSLTRSKLIITFLFLTVPVFGQVPSSSKNAEIASSVNSILNVTAAPFLATGKGVTDDAPAIQRALDTLHARGGGAIFIPAGTYLIKEPVKVYSNTTVLGLGYKSLIKGDIYLNTGGIWGIMNAVLHVQPGSDGVVIQNVHVQGPWTSGASISTHCILLDSTTSYCRILNNYLDHASWAGVLTRKNNSIGHIIAGNDVSDCAVNGIEIWGDHNTVSGNYVLDCGLGTPGAGGIQVDVEGPGTTSGSVNWAVHDILINGNTIIGGKMGIAAAAGYISELTISNNVIYGTRGRAINLYAADSTLKYVTIANNIISGTTGEYVDGRGISIGQGTSFFSILGNQINNCNRGSSDGIVIERSASKGSIANNTITHCNVGIVVADSTVSDIQVWNNTVLFNADNTIRDSGTRTRITTNKTSTQGSSYETFDKAFLKDSVSDPPPKR